MSANRHRWARPMTALLLGLLLALPPLWRWMDAAMARQMLLQFPALLAFGVLLGSLLAPGIVQRLQRFNAQGVSGWALATLVLAFWMVPRALDLALREPLVGAAKLLSLAGAGLAVQLAWRASGTVVRLFFVGNAVWMTATVGLLYLDSPARLCNAYLIDDQLIAGRGLVLLALLGGLGWCGLLLGAASDDLRAGDGPAERRLIDARSSRRTQP